MKIKIKKHLNKNEYVLSKDGHWVRNFTKSIVKPIDINDLMPIEDMQLMLRNEIKNDIKSYAKLENESFTHDKIVIIGDGYNFDASLKLVEDLPSDVVVIGVNGAFARWNLQRRLNYYVVNNPYQECLYYYPQIIRTWPKCIASIRTNPNFLEVYQGSLYVYFPVNNEIYYNESADLYIDDYRNSVCAAISLAYKFHAKKILLLSTLEMYDAERSGMINEKEGRWFYPQQRTAKSLIDANLYWLKTAKIATYYNDSNPDYEFATYINSNDLKKAFNER